MDTPENKKFNEIVDIVKSWILRRTEQVSVSRDFWMPDQSCRVCYECDSQFTVFNRRHHCRLCGRVFCAKCASNSVPIPNEEPKAGREDGDRIRVCNFCFKQWQQGLATVDSRLNLSSPGLSPSPSTTSLASNQSGCTCNSGSSGSSTIYPTGPYQHVTCSSCQSASQSAQMGPAALKLDEETSPGNPDSGHFVSCYRSDDEDDNYGACGGEYHSRYRSTEEHRNAMKNVVDGHFKALIVQLLQVENIPPAEEDNKESWSEIITSLSWEAATFLKPDMSQNGGTDPCGYVKIKCIACGHHRERKWNI